MANLATTIKNYKELKEQISLVVDNQKELNKAIKEAYSTNNLGLVNKLKKELAEQNIEFKDLNKTIEETADALSNELGDSFYIIENSSNGIRKELKRLERDMRDLALAGQSTSEEYKNMQARALELGHVIKQTSSDISSGATTIGGQFAQLGTAMASLDFDTIITRANTLSNSLSKVSWQSFTKGIKGARTAFANLGKTLLANPIFLIATIVIALGAAIYKLMKETGLLEVAMESLGKVFDILLKPLHLLIAGLKQLTDWLGFTNNAEKELAATRLLDAENDEKRTQNLVKNANDRLNIFTNELKRELKELKESGQLTIEEERRIQTQINYNNRKIAENNHKESQAILNSNEKELEKFRADHKRNIDSLAGDDKKLYDELKASVESAKISVMQTHSEIDEALSNGQSELRRITKDNERTEGDSLAIRQQQYKTFIENRKNAQRQIRELMIELIEDDLVRGMKEIDERQRQFEEDTLASTTLNQEEKNKIILLSREKLEKNITDLVDKHDKDIERKEIDHQKRMDIIRKRQISETSIALDMIDQLRLDSIEKERLELEKDIEKNKDLIIEKMVREQSIKDSFKLREFETEKERIKNNNDIEESIRIELLEKLEEAEKEFLENRKNNRINAEIEVRDQIKEINKDRNNSLIDSMKDSISIAMAGYDTLFNDITNTLTNSFEQLNILFDTEFENSTERILQIAALALSTLNGLINGMSNEINRQMKEDIDALVDSYNDRFDRLDAKLKGGIISQQEYDETQKKLTDKRNKEQLKLEKQAFDDKKKLDIASATTSMLTGIVSAWANAMQLPPPMNVITGTAMSALMSGIGLANINKIKSQKFGGSTNSSPSMNVNVDSGGGGGNLTAPTFTFQGNDSNNETTIGDDDTNQSPTIIIDNYISATEITEVQQSNSDTETFAQLTG